MDSTTQETLTARDYLRPLWARKWSILLLVVAVTAATYYYYNRQPRVYQTSTDIYLKSAPGGVEGSGLLTERTIANLARLLRSRAVAERAAKELGFQGDPEALLGSINVSPSAQSDFLTISAVSSSGQGAASIANAFAKGFIDERTANERAQTRQFLQAAQDRFSKLPKNGSLDTQAERKDLRDQIRQLQVTLALPTDTAEQLDKARAPGGPIAPNPRRTAIFAFALSLLLAGVAAYFLDRLDRRIRGVDALEPIYDAPVLVGIPRSTDVEATREGFPALPPDVFESFRTRRTRLDLESQQRELQSILVTSGVPGEGKSMLTRNLALAYQESGRRVALIDADLRRPGLTNVLDLQPAYGLTDVLAHRCGLRDALQPIKEGGSMLGLETPALPPSPSPNGDGADHAGGIWLLTGGPAAANPPTLLASEGFASVLSELERRFDVVLIDSPPLLVVSDAIPLLSATDGTLVVSRVGTTTQDAASAVVQLINRTPGAKLLGVIANEVPLRDRHATYGAVVYQ